ncbi:hypothetical protein SALBM311S_00491 [Streptomyces alboniger]
MFGTDLNNEYAVAARLLDLDERGLAELAKNAVEASFLDEAGKSRDQGRDRHVHRWLARPRPHHNGRMQKLTAVAHRGYPYRVRENTVDSLLSALRRARTRSRSMYVSPWDGVPVLLHDDTLKRLWEHERPLLSLSADEVRGLRTGGGVPTLAQALTATEGNRVLLDLPGTPDVRAARRVVDVVRECGARERVYDCAGASAMLAVRAADPAAEIALTWTTLAPPRPALLDAVRPRWLNYRFGLVDRALAERVHADGCLLSVCGLPTRAARCAASWPWASTRSPPTASTSCARSATAPCATATCATRPANWRPPGGGARYSGPGGTRDRKSYTLVASAYVAGSAGSRWVTYCGTVRSLPVSRTRPYRFAPWSGPVVTSFSTASQLDGKMLRP